MSLTDDSVVAHCKHHGDYTLREIGCPKCIVELREKNKQWERDNQALEAVVHKTTAEVVYWKKQFDGATAEIRKLVEQLAEHNSKRINLQDYRNAPSGVGPLADTWKDKPARLIYDLVVEVRACIAEREDAQRTADEFHRQLEEANAKWSAQFWACLNSLALAELPITVNDKNQVEIPELYDVAKKICHEFGISWTDPRTGVKYDPPVNLPDADTMRDEYDFSKLKRRKDGK